MKEHEKTGKQMRNKIRPPRPQALTSRDRAEGLARRATFRYTAVRPTLLTMCWQGFRAQGTRLSGPRPAGHAPATHIRFGLSHPCYTPADLFRKVSCLPTKANKRQFFKGRRHWTTPPTWPATPTNQYEFKLVKQRFYTMNIRYIQIFHTTAPTSIFRGPPAICH